MSRLFGSGTLAQNIIAEIDTPAQSVGLSGICLTLSRTIFLSSPTPGAGCVVQVQPTSQPSPPSQPRLGEKQCLHCGSEMRLVSVMPGFSNGGSTRRLTNAGIARVR